jgi:hypothetical protein
MKIFSTLPVIALLAASPMAYGVVVYDNGGPDQVGGNESTMWLQTENFQLTSPSTIGAAEFWTGEIGSAWDGTLSWWIFDNNAGQPGTILASGAGAGVTKVATGTSMSYLGVEYKYDFSLNGVPTLAAGTTYWFGIHLSSDWSRDEIYWETTNPSGNGTESQGGTMDNWYNNGQEHAFNLSGVSTVPDACSTAMLLGLTLTFLGVARRRGKA